MTSKLLKAKSTETISKGHSCLFIICYKYKYSFKIFLKSYLKFKEEIENMYQSSSFLVHKGPLYMCFSSLRKVKQTCNLCYLFLYILKHCRASCAVMLVHLLVSASVCSQPMPISYQPMRLMQHLW